MLIRLCAVSLSIVLVVPLAAGCAGSDTDSHAESAHKSHWGYEGDVGPDHWADLDPAYALARDGRSQSPIDLKAAAAAAGPELGVAWKSGPLVIENNGHTVQITATPGGTLTVGANSYSLKQFHFHAPSEHTKDGTHAPLEVHFVHGDDSGNAAVVGLFVHEGAANAALGIIADHAPASAGSKATPAGVEIDPSALLPGSLTTWRYSGSLTTPPCTEGVKWYVLQQPVEASHDQLDALATTLDGNNRPTQPLNGREVESVK